MSAFIGMATPGADFSSSQVPSRVSRAIFPGAFSSGFGQEGASAASRRSSAWFWLDSATATSATSCAGGAGNGSSAST